jgi:hypothetical protein
VDKVYKILELAKNGVPQALMRANDGECGIIFDKNFTAARGCQRGSIELQIALIDTIRHEQKNYWKGYPCSICYPKLYKKIVEAGYFNPDYKYNTKAVVNTNRNLCTFSCGLQNALIGKKVIWVSGRDQRLEFIDFDITKHIKAPLKNSWVHYSDLLQQCLDSVMPHVVFLFSCGPVARVLVRSLFQMRPDATFLDIGDTYSPETRGILRKCHTGNLKDCEECN